MIVSLLAFAAHADVYRFALLIGSNDGTGDDVELRFAEDDAVRMQRVLQSHGGLRPENTVLARGVPATSFDGLLEELGQRIRRRLGPGDEGLVLVYYSGHADARALRSAGSTLPFNDLLDGVSALPADVKILIVDACQSGELTRRKGATIAEPFAIRPAETLDSQGMAIMASSTAGEDAQESERLRGGVFTHHLVGGLLGAADTSGDSAVNLEEAWRYAQAQTVRSTSDAPFVQHPSFAYALRGSRTLVLTDLSADPSSARVTLKTPGTWVLFGQQRDTVTEIEAADRVQLSLPGGSYTVRLRQPTGVRQARMQLKRGDQVALSGAQMAPVARGRVVRKGIGQGYQRAWGFAVGLSATGPITPDVGASPAIRMGPQLELDELSVGLRADYTYQVRNDDLIRQDQHVVGFTTTVGRLGEIGPFSMGGAIRAGGSAVLQQFETQGSATPRRGLIGRIGPEFDAELPLAPRSTLRFAAALDLAVVPLVDPATGDASPSTHSVWSITMEVLRYGS